MGQLFLRWLCNDDVPRYSYQYQIGRGLKCEMMIINILIMTLREANVTLIERVEI